MLVQLQPQAVKEEDDVEVPVAPTHHLLQMHLHHLHKIVSLHLYKLNMLHHHHHYFDGNMCYLVPKSCSVRTRQNFSSIGDSQAQEEGQEVKKEEEIKVFWFKEVKK
nr:hypothetical protein [Tanacetum cinerariifolium]